MNPESKQTIDQQLEDERWMRAALEWAWRGKGWTSPRPCVGAVLVRDGAVLGGGHTQPGDGQPHAEVMALRQTRDNGFNSRGATAYVTLEPCSHWGTTPPCCDALIEAGVVRVAIGVHDPNPLVSGRGVERMRAAGIEVVEGVLEKECRHAQDDFLHTIVQKTPFVTLKAGISLDGKIALPSGQSKWITNSRSRERAHLLRHQNDAVLVGIETVFADDPSLSVRLEGRYKQPARIVLDSRGRLPLDAKIWEGASQLIVATAGAKASRVEELRDHGATVLECEADSEGRIAWKPLLDQLFQIGINSILIEGGSRVAGSALGAAVVGKVAFFVAPLLIGEGKPALGGFELQDLGLAPRLRDVYIENLDGDVLVEGYL